MKTSFLNGLPHFFCAALYHKDLKFANHKNAVMNSFSFFYKKTMLHLHEVVSNEKWSRDYLVHCYLNIACISSKQHRDVCYS